MGEMYTERLLDHYRKPRNRGHLEPRDTRGDATAGRYLKAEEYNPLCGDRVTVEVWVEASPGPDRHRGERIVEARWEGRGCALCLGAASILTETIQGRELGELRGLDAEAFLTELQSEPRPSRLKCALLPWMAFRRAAYGEEEWPLLER